MKTLDVLVTGTLVTYTEGNVAPSVVMFSLKSIACISGGINFSWRRKKQTVREGDNGSRGS